MFNLINNEVRMLKRFPILKSSYDEKSKIWSGAELKSYYDWNCSFGRIAFEELRRRPSHIFQISDSENTKLTNNDVLLHAIRIVRYFESLGLKQSDIIGFSGRNSTYVIAVILACFFSGSACHAISPNFDKETSKKLFSISTPRVIFCDGQDLEKIKYASTDFETQIFTLTNHIAEMPAVMDLLHPKGDEDEYYPAELENGVSQNLIILCSSGSTGTPKPVTVPNSNKGYMCFDFTNEEDVQFVATTLDWTTGILCLMACIVYGSTRVVSDKPLTPEYFLEVVEKYKVTFTLQTPPTTASLVKSPHISKAKLDSMRYYFVAGSACPVSLLHSMQSYLRNGQMVQAYGFTEFNECLVKTFYHENKHSSIGRLLPGHKARIVNENGKNLGPNERGELLSKRQGTWSGYFQNPEATRTIYDEDGWFHSGDLSYFDEDNYLYIVERIKELLKYKAMHYYPSEIEQVIAQMPDVKEVCVFGIEKDTEGEMAAAAVVKVKGSSLTAEDVVEYVRKNIEAYYKHLHGGCKLFDAIPKTANNKYNRKAAKELFLKYEN